MAKNIGSYVGAGTKKSKIQIPVFTLAPPDPELTRKALYLIGRFANVSGRVLHGKYLERFANTHLLSFIKLANRLDAWRLRGVHVNSTTYMMAHRWYYGKEMFVNHLLSPKSYEIYESYMRMKKAVHVKYTAEDYASYDQEVVHSIAESREESLEETQEILELVGLL